MFKRHQRLVLPIVFASISYIVKLQAEALPTSADEGHTIHDARSKRQMTFRRNADGNEVWGYVNVRPAAYMFYWLYHSIHPDGYLTRPLIIWFQGGPGGSSTGFGNFAEIGPLDVNLNPRNTTWVKEANVMFIDNPVGAGYSYVAAGGSFTTNVQEISDDLTTLLIAFMVNFPEFRTVPIYVFGESYGGKMASHFARHLYYEVQAGRLNVNIAGFALGDSWIEPTSQITSWSDLLYEMSLVDPQGRDLVDAEAQKVKEAIEAEDWFGATQGFFDTEIVILNITNSVDFYNILKFGSPFASSRQTTNEIWQRMHYHLTKLRGIRQPPELAPATDPADPLIGDLMNGQIRQKLGIIPDNVVWGDQFESVFDNQAGDYMKSVIDVVDDALSNTTLKVIIYQGQLDLICSTGGVMKWVQLLKWNGLNNFNSANRYWFLDEATGQTQMFVKAHDRFKFYWILGAGHSVPQDNGDAAYRMVQRIIADLDV